MIELPSFSSFLRRPPWLLAIVACVVVFTLPACKRTPPPKPTNIVQVTPVLTRPFEEGYTAGYDKGKAAAAPRAKLPKAADVDAMAEAAAAEDELRAEKWKRGWSEGYMDGFRSVATHQR